MKTLFIYLCDIKKKN